jgi:hypothetical protein
MRLVGRSGVADYSPRVPKYAAFLRGVNLGRNRRVTGPQLKSMFERLGFEEVADVRAGAAPVALPGQTAKESARFPMDQQPG